MSRRRNRILMRAFRCGSLRVALALRALITLMSTILILISLVSRQRWRRRKRILTLRNRIIGPAFSRLTSRAVNRNRQMAPTLNLTRRNIRKESPSLHLLAWYRTTLARRNRRTVPRRPSLAFALRRWKNARRSWKNSNPLDLLPRQLLTLI